MQLQIKLTFAYGLYHGRTEKGALEFPPSPSRLFQALIAGSHYGVYELIHSDQRDQALRWLESLEPPSIKAPVVYETGKGIINYVPNNDDKFPSAQVPNSGHVRTAKQLLANIFPDDKSVTYYWSFDGDHEAERHAKVICAMSQLITHLGHHQDVVFAHGEVFNNSTLTDSSNMSYAVDDQDGDQTVPRLGALEAYRERYKAGLLGKPREDIIVPTRRVRYRSSETIKFDAPKVLFDLWRNEDERLRYDPRDLRQPAAMVKHAMLEWVKANPSYVSYYGQELISRLIAGHDGGLKYDGEHIACVPIPSLNAEGQADGLIRRVLVIGYGCNDLTSMELFESLTDGINGADLIDRSKRIGFLKKGSWNDSILQLITGRGHRVWRTVTPIILTGLMRRGRGAEHLIARALIQAGMNERNIKSIASFSGPIIPKTVRALEYNIEQNSYLSQTPRYHAEVMFNHPVEGMLVIGRGRHCGFGLMMPSSMTGPEFSLLGL